MKRILSLVFCSLLLLGLFPLLPVSKTVADAFSADIYEPYYILVNADRPNVSYRGIELEADRQVYPASTTKILTCIVALENGNLNDMVTVSAKAVDFGNGNSLMGLEQGEQYSLKDLLYGLMLPSGNDAAIAIAEHIAGSTEAYADMMNAKAQEIGMTHSHFVTVHGKQNENHYTTVRDMAILTAYALKTSGKSEDFRTIVGTKTYVAESGPRALTLVNSNRMLVDTPPTEKLTNPISCLYEDAIGVKTGDTNAAGKCLVAAAERNDVTLIAVLYGGTKNDPDYNDGWSDARKDKYNARRFQDAAAMFDYAFGDMLKTYSFREFVEAGVPVEFDITVANASPDDSQGGVLKAKANISLDTMIQLMKPDPDTTIGELGIQAVPSVTSMYAPISEGSTVGNVSYIYKGNTIANAELVATRSVKEGTAVTDIKPVEAPTNTEQPQVYLIGEANEPTVTDGTVQEVKPKEEKTGLPLGLLIVLIVLVVILLVVIVLFVLYMRAEAKRRAAARRRAARRRAREAELYGDRR